MNKILKAILLIASAIIFGVIGLLLWRKSKGKPLIPKDLNDLKDDLGINAATPQTPDSTGASQGKTPEVPVAPSTPSLSEKGKTLIEQDNQKGKILAAAGIGAVGAIVAKPVFGRVIQAGKAIATTTKAAITTGKVTAKTISATTKATTITGKATAAVSKAVSTIKSTSAFTKTAATTGKIAATVSKAANPVLSLGKGAVSAVTKVAATTGIKAVAKVAGKAFLPLTVAMALWDTKTLADKKEAQGSLTVGDIVGQYTGLGGLGIGKKLPSSVMSLFNTKAL
jgi:hypothetical protein